MCKPITPTIKLSYLIKITFALKIILANPIGKLCSNICEIVYSFIEYHQVHHLIGVVDKDHIVSKFVVTCQHSFGSIVKLQKFQARNPCVCTYSFHLMLIYFGVTFVHHFISAFPGKYAFCISKTPLYLLYIPFCCDIYFTFLLNNTPYI